MAGLPLLYYSDLLAMLGSLVLKLKEVSVDWQRFHYTPKNLGVEMSTKLKTRVNTHLDLRVSQDLRPSRVALFKLRGALRS